MTAPPGLVPPCPVLYPVAAGEVAAEARQICGNRGANSVTGDGVRGESETERDEPGGEPERGGDWRFLCTVTDSMRTMTMWATQELSRVTDPPVDRAPVYERVTWLWLERAIQRNGDDAC